MCSFQGSISCCHQCHTIDTCCIDTTGPIGARAYGSDWDTGGGGRGGGVRDYICMHVVGSGSAVGGSPSLCPCSSQARFLDGRWEAGGVRGATSAPNAATNACGDCKHAFILVSDGDACYGLASRMTSGTRWLRRRLGERSSV